MARRLIWSPAAAVDVEAIVTFIDRDSFAYATSVARRIVAAVDAFADLPLASAIVADRDDPSLRQVRVHDYRIVVRVSPDAVEVVAVVHAARDIGSILDERL